MVCVALPCSQCMPRLHMLSSSYAPCTYPHPHSPPCVHPLVGVRSPPHWCVLTPSSACIPCTPSSAFVRPSSAFVCRRQHSFAVVGVRSRPCWRSYSFALVRAHVRATTTMRHLLLRRWWCVVTICRACLCTCHQRLAVRWGWGTHHVRAMTTTHHLPLRHRW